MLQKYYHCTTEQLVRGWRNARFGVRRPECESQLICSLSRWNGQVTLTSLVVSSLIHKMGMVNNTFPNISQGSQHVHMWKHFISYKRLGPLVSIVGIWILHQFLPLLGSENLPHFPTLSFLSLHCFISHL